MMSLVPCMAMAILDRRRQDHVFINPPPFSLPIPVKNMSSAMSGLDQLRAGVCAGPPSLPPSLSLSLSLSISRERERERQHLFV